jgi:FtsH-binding integral membrane protein
VAEIQQHKRRLKGLDEMPAQRHTLREAFVSRFKWVMVVAGILTCTMFYAAIAPVPSQRSNFGEALDGPLAQIVVRNWGVLIGLVGLMLLYGAFSEANRRMALWVAATSKIAFIALVLTYGQHFLRFQVGTAVVVDSIMVVLFAVYLLVTRRDHDALAR